MADEPANAVAVASRAVAERRAGPDVHRRRAVTDDGSASSRLPCFAAVLLAKDFVAEDSAAPPPPSPLPSGGSGGPEPCARDSPLPVLASKSRVDGALSRTSSACSLGTYGRSSSNGLLLSSWSTANASSSSFASSLRRTYTNGSGVDAASQASSRRASVSGVSGCALRGRLPLPLLPEGRVSSSGSNWGGLEDVLCEQLEIAFEMLGERDEALEELRDELREVKAIYREHVGTLVPKPELPTVAVKPSSDGANDSSSSVAATPSVPPAAHDGPRTPCRLGDAQAFASPREGQ